MTVRELAEKLKLEVVAGSNLEIEFSGAYFGDIPHDVMQMAAAGNVWFTTRDDLVVVGAALLADIAAVILVEDKNYEQLAIKKACDKKVNLLRYSGSKYDLAIRFSELTREQ